MKWEARTSAATVPDAEPVAAAWRIVRDALVSRATGGDHLSAAEARALTAMQNAILRATPTRAEVDAKIEAAALDCSEAAWEHTENPNDPPLDVERFKGILRSHFGATVEKSDG